MLANNEPDSPKIKITSVHLDGKHGEWYIFAGAREFVEIRVTKTGLLRVGEPVRMKHPVFTPK